MQLEHPAWFYCCHWHHCSLQESTSHCTFRSGTDFQPTLLIAIVSAWLIVLLLCFQRWIYITHLRTLVIRFVTTFIYCDYYCTATFYSATCSARGTHNCMYSRINNQSINQSIYISLWRVYFSIGNFCGSWFGDCSIGLAWGSENGIWPVKPFAGAESCLRAQKNCGELVILPATLYYLSIRCYMCLKLKFCQYSSIHTNYIIPHCTTLQYNHNIWHGT